MRCRARPGSDSAGTQSLGLAGCLLADVGGIHRESRRFNKRIILWHVIGKLQMRLFFLIINSSNHGWNTDYWQKHVGQGVISQSNTGSV